MNRMGAWERSNGGMLYRTMGRCASNRVLVLGLLVSLVLHVVVAGVLVHRVQARRPDRPMLTSRRPEDPRPPLHLGVRDSQAVTLTWVGFEVPSEHEARLSEVEQAAFSPGTGGQVAVQAPERIARRSSQPNEPQHVTHDEAVTQDQAAEVASAMAGPARTPAEKPSAVPEPRPDPEAALALGPVHLPPVVGPTPPEVPDHPRPTKKATPTPAQSRPFQQAAPRAEREVRIREARRESRPTAVEPRSGSGPSDQPGARADKESPATSRKKPVRVHPGRPVAAQGLEIKTVKPRFGLATSVLVVPRDPVVRITFNRRGRVIRAEFLKGRNTGSPDVDTPLLNAVYRWRATGKAIDDLPKSDPDATVVIEMQILL